MSETKTECRKDAPANLPWLAKFQEVLSLELASRLKAGYHGTLSLELTIRDGTIQGLRNTSVASYRP